jgi:glycosyltransferase involved in cell wall biosynthesis
MSVNSTFFSVITPLYNKQRSIRRAIDSVLAQTTADFEMIIVDDGSTDDSAEQVRRVDDERIRLVQQENRGAAAARNHGISLARAEHLAFLDADDAWMPQFLASVSSLIARYPEAGAWATGYFIQNAGRSRSPAMFQNVPTSPSGGLISSYFAVAARGSNPMWSSAVCIPKRTFVRVGGFPDGVRLYEDLHLWGRIAIEFPIAYDARPLAIYFRDAENRRGPVASHVSDLSFANPIKQALMEGRLSDKEARHAREFIAHYTLLCAFKTLMAGRPRTARAVAARAEVIRPATHLKRAFIRTLTYLPRNLVLTAWHAGRAIKSLKTALFLPKSG